MKNGSQMIGLQQSRPAANVFQSKQESSMRTNFVARISFAFALMSSTSSVFAAVDAQKVADALKGHMKNYAIELAIGSAEAQGDNVVLKGITVDIAGEDTLPKQLGELTLEGVTDADGGFKVARVAVPGSKIEDPQGIFEWSGLSINNVTISGPDVADPMRLYSLYESVDIGPMKATIGGVEVFRMAGGKATISPYAAGQSMVSTATFSDLVFSLATITDPNLKTFFDGAGYKELVTNVTLNGSWNPADGRMSITQYDFDIKDFGKLGFTFDVAGYTPELIKQLQGLTQAQSASDAEMGAKLMGIIQGVTINSVSMRFDDASITNKVLDHFSKQTGQPKEALVAQVKGMAPVLAMQAGDANFSMSLASAVSSYMDAPKNIEIKTGAPVPVTVIMGAAMANPMAIIQAFKLEAKANQ
jgi:hypothetical protein